MKPLFCCIGFQIFRETWNDKLFARDRYGKAGLIGVACFLQDVGNVILHSPLRNTKGLGDLAVLQAVAHKAQHLDFFNGQICAGGKP